MKDFLEGFQDFMENVALEPLNGLRALELESWAGANIMNWIFMTIGSAAFIYWMLQLKKYNDNDEEDRDPKAHSFLG